MVSAHSSVGIILYHRQLHSLLLVRQFRPAVYASRWMEAEAEGRPQPPLSAGFTFELCAGIIDKTKSLEDIAREEVPAPLTTSNLPSHASIVIRQTLLPLH